VLAAFLIAFVLSFFGSMPIAGPIAVIVVSRGLDNRPRSGLFIAIGAAIAESVYAGLAFLGLTAMLERYPLLLPISRLFGCLILTFLGVYFIARSPKKPEDKKEAAKKDAATTALRSGFLGLSVTALNPTLIVTWTAAVGVAQSTGFLRVRELDALPFAGGVLAGIISWFATFLWLLVRFQKKLQPGSIDRAIKGMGVVLILAGLGFGARTLLAWHGAH
jgi:threonine/homoserine/homoserine lactone efflux protein